MNACTSGRVAAADARQLPSQSLCPAALFWLSPAPSPCSGQRSSTNLSHMDLSEARQVLLQVADVLIDDATKAACALKLSRRLLLQQQRHGVPGSALDEVRRPAFHNTFVLKRLSGVSMVPWPPRVCGSPSLPLLQVCCVLCVCCLCAPLVQRGCRERTRRAHCRGFAGAHRHKWCQMFQSSGGGHYVCVCVCGSSSEWVGGMWELFIGYGLVGLVKGVSHEFVGSGVSACLAKCSETCPFAMVITTSAGCRGFECGVERGACQRGGNR